jgi:ferredoxin
MDIKTWEGEEVTIKVDYDKCSGKGECADACPSSVYEVQGGKAGFRLIGCRPLG